MRDHTLFDKIDLHLIRVLYTTGRQYCERYADGLPLIILPCPIEFPRMMYYQLWHERTHTSAASKWLRERVKAVAANLKKNQRSATA